MHGLLQKCIDPVEKVLRDSKISKEGVYEVVLVGGSTRIHKVQSMLPELSMERRFANQ